MPSLLVLALGAARRLPETRIQAAHLPVHLGSTPLSVRAALDLGPLAFELSLGLAVHLLVDGFTKGIEEERFGHAWQPPSGRQLISG